MNQKIEDAKLFAIRHHGLQEYDGFPYHKHLQDVVSNVIKFGYVNEDFVIAAWLHDSIEDCSVTYNDIKKLFGESVAEIVYRVTDELGRNRKERKKKTYPKIRECKNATFIKLCDRIANFENSIKRGHSMIDAYIKEHAEFKHALKVEHEWDDAWDYLDGLIIQQASTKLTNKI